jgi:hypothetical protein
MTVGAFSMRVPKPGYVPGTVEGAAEGGGAGEGAGEGAGGVKEAMVRSLSLPTSKPAYPYLIEEGRSVHHNTAMTTYQFPLLWGTIFTNAVAGVAVISCAKDIMKDCMGTALPHIVDGAAGTRTKERRRKTEETERGKERRRLYTPQCTM